MQPVIVYSWHQGSMLMTWGDNFNKQPHACILYVWVCMHSYQTLNALNPCLLTKSKQRDTRDALTPFNFGPPPYAPMHAHHEVSFQVISIFTRCLSKQAFSSKMPCSLIFFAHEKLTIF